jgi:hypothetical protein
MAGSIRLVCLAAVVIGESLRCFDRNERQIATCLSHQFHGFRVSRPCGTW